MTNKHSAGKGDRYRSLDTKKYDDNYDKIFNKKKVKTKNKKENKK